jgi:molecular chaperone DnaK
VVRIHVLQGEREMAEDNKSLGRFELVGIPPAPRGVPQIEVIFEIDTDGVVHVSAKDLGTGKSQQIRVSASGGLTETEIQALIAEAEAHAASDHDRRELVDLRNKADGLIYSTERALEEYAQHIGEPERRALEAAIEKTRAAIGSADAAGLRSAVDELSGLSYQMTETLYSVLGASGAE